MVRSIVRTERAMQRTIPKPQKGQLKHARCSNYWLHWTMPFCWLACVSKPWNYVHSVTRTSQGLRLYIPYVIHLKKSCMSAKPVPGREQSGGSKFAVFAVQVALVIYKSGYFSSAVNNLYHSCIILWASVPLLISNSGGNWRQSASTGTWNHLT